MSCEHNCILIGITEYRLMCSNCGEVFELDKSEPTVNDETEWTPASKPFRVNVTYEHGASGGLGTPRKIEPIDVDAYGKVVHTVTKRDDMVYVETGSYDVKLKITDYNIEATRCGQTETKYIHGQCEEDEIVELIEEVAQ